MSDDEEKIYTDDPINYEPYYWLLFMIILGYLFYYFKDKKIFSRGLLKWIYIIFFTIYICVSIISILLFLFFYIVTDGFTKTF